MTDKTCKTCIHNENGCYDHLGVLVEDDDYCDRWRGQSWCPLRELPKKKPERILTKLGRTASVSRFKECDLNIGWNACLELITKEREKYEDTGLTPEEIINERTGEIHESNV